LQKSYQAIKAENAELVVITTDEPAVVKSTANKNKLGFVTLSDTNRQAIDVYNAADPFNPRIARPQYYIIDDSGVIQWKFLDNRKVDRLQSNKVVEALKKL
jgi:peroxiredoxin